MVKFFTKNIEVVQFLSLFWLTPTERLVYTHLKMSENPTKSNKFGLILWLSRARDFRGRHGKLCQFPVNQRRNYKIVQSFQPLPAGVLGQWKYQLGRENFAFISCFVLLLISPHNRVSCHCISSLFTTQKGIQLQTNITLQNLLW